MTSQETTAPTPTTAATFRPRRDAARRLLSEIDAIDHAMYDAVTLTPTPTLDVPVTWIANAANYSRTSIVIAGALWIAGGDTGGRAAAKGLVAVGVTSAISNLVAKRLADRRRPDRATPAVGRNAPMPTSSSFPSGHTASAFAFAAAVTGDLPNLAFPLYSLATIVGYSRVHTGVHYPSDVLGGAILGLAIGTMLRRTTSRRPRS